MTFRLNTTMHYAMVKQQNVKLAHRKYIGWDGELFEYEKVFPW